MATSIARAILLILLSCLTSPQLAIIAELEQFHSSAPIIRARVNWGAVSPRLSARAAPQGTAGPTPQAGGKGFIHVCSSGRSSHVFGLLARFS